MVPKILNGFADLISWLDKIQAQPDDVTDIINRYVIEPKVILSKQLEYADKSLIKNIIKFELINFSTVIVEALKIILNVSRTDEFKISTITGKHVPTDVIRALGAEEVTEKILDDKRLFAGFENDKGNASNIKIEGVNVYINIKYARRVGDKTIVIDIPIFIKPTILYIDVKDFIDLMIGEVERASFSNRLDELRSGAIGWKEFLFASDLVKDYKKKRISSESELYALIKEKETKAGLKKLLTLKDVSAYYNLYNFTMEERPYIESAIKCSIKSDKCKMKLIEELKAHSISFIDLHKEKMIYITKFTRPYSVIPFNMLNNGKQGLDTDELLKTLIAGKSPF